MDEREILDKILEDHEFVSDINDIDDNECVFDLRDMKEAIKLACVFIGRVERCRNSKFNGIECLESSKQYGFFKDSNDVRPSSCTWIDKEDASKLLEVFNK